MISTLSPHCGTDEASRIAFSLIFYNHPIFPKLVQNLKFISYKLNLFRIVLIISHDVHSCATSDFDREKTVFVYSKSIHDRNSSGV